MSENTATVTINGETIDQIAAWLIERGWTVLGLTKRHPRRLRARFDAADREARFAHRRSLSIFEPWDEHSKAYIIARSFVPYFREFDDYHEAEAWARGLENAPAQTAATEEHNRP